MQRSIAIPASFICGRATTQQVAYEVGPTILCSMHQKRITVTVAAVHVSAPVEPSLDDSQISTLRSVYEVIRKIAGFKAFYEVVSYRRDAFPPEILLAPRTPKRTHSQLFEFFLKLLRTPIFMPGAAATTDLVSEIPHFLQSLSLVLVVVLYKALVVLVAAVKKVVCGLLHRY